jgi:Heterokaryon incompatibility protein Het-C
MAFCSRQSSICVWHLDSLFVGLDMVMMPLIKDVSPFQAHGYATEEFEVTVERLGVYLPVSIPSNTTSENHSFISLFRRNTSTTPRAMVTVKIRGSMIGDYAGP